MVRSSSSITPPQTITITDNAVRRILFLQEQSVRPNLMLRLAVSGGGCAGFQYHFSLEEVCHEDDVTFERLGVLVVIDVCSLTLLDGISIDYVEDLTHASFQVHNPNATSSCGCGTSFAI